MNIWETHIEKLFENIELDGICHCPVLTSKSEIVNNKHILCGGIINHV